MKLSRRPAVYELPSYSLTADLLGFLRCGLQYRYTRIGRLPASRPVQMWFGQFIHGVLEEGFRRYAVAAALGESSAAPPWDQATLVEIRDLVKARLASQGLHAWDNGLEELGDRRADAAINELGASLFPLIHRAEVRLTGSRHLPSLEGTLRFREADRYEMIGVVDVITHVELRDPCLANNALVQIMRETLGEEFPEEFEVIIDYKGMRRPSSTQTGADSLWNQYGWQLQTYAHLRSLQPDHLPIAAGLIIYLNELVPTTSDMSALRKEIQLGETDVVPISGTPADSAVKLWRRVADTLPFDFRLQRAVRVVEVSERTIGEALDQFDGVVARIEHCRGSEVHTGRIIDSWEKNTSDEGTCAACDARTYCPAYTKTDAPRIPAA